MKALRKQIEDEALFGIAAPTSWPAAVISWNEHAVADLGDDTLKRYLVSLKQLRPFLDEKLITQINAETLREIAKARRKQGATSATIRRDLTAMSSVIEHAIEEGWIETNPTLAFRRRIKEKFEPIMLPQAASIAMMEAASPPRFADAQEFARKSGMREEEIFALRHRDLNERDETITIVGKGRKLRVIPYTTELREIVARQPRYLKSEIVFWHGAGERWASPGSRFTDIRRRVARKAAQAKAALMPYRFHDLRHLYAVEYLRQGKGSIYDLKDLLGHESVKTTERYLAFLTPEEKQRAMHGVAQNAARKQRSGGAVTGKN